MGQHADDLADWEYRTFQRPHIEFIDGPLKTPTKPRWHTVNGQTLLVEDMETSHIINSINKLKREGRTMYQPLMDELTKRRAQKYKDIT